MNFHYNTEMSEKLYFDGVKVLDEKVDLLCLMTLKSDRKFEEKLTLNSKNDMRNLVNFNAGSEVRKICTLMCYFCRKYIMFEPKKYRGIMCHNTEE